MVWTTSMKPGLCLLAFSCLALSCNRGSGDSHSAGLEQACTVLAASQCEKEQSCSPSLFRSQFQDLEVCVARTQLTCPIIARAPGSGYTTSSVVACATALSAATCADLANNLGPSACRMRGTLEVGAVCMDDAQCAGAENFCKRSGECGVCVARKPESDRAAYGDCGSSQGCQDGLVCTLGRCLPPVDPSEACDLGHPCPAPYACDNAVCIPATLPLGATCDVYGQACDDSQGLRCVDDACIVMPTAQLGETCGLQGNLVTSCLAGAVCDVVEGNYLGVCRPPLADGDACDDQPYLYDPCRPPATCTDGFCNLPEPLACGLPDAGAS